MNSHYNRDSDLRDLHDEIDEPVGNDREISLGTSTILGIFFALALICAVFFGFGYSMGRRSAQPAVSTAEPVAATSSTSNKPTPGSLAPAPSTDNAGDETAAPVSTQLSSPASPSVTLATPNNQPDNQPDSQSGTQSGSQSALPAKPGNKPAPVVRVPPAAVSSAPTFQAAVAPGVTTAVVQVAAVSHQEDADVLLSALKKRGYTVVIRQEPQDKLLHVQLGPFPSKKDADAMRQRLLADGYNAIVK